MAFGSNGLAELSMSRKVSFSTCMAVLLRYARPTPIDASVPIWPGAVDCQWYWSRTGWHRNFRFLLGSMIAAEFMRGCKNAVSHRSGS